jgi:hypothetical protein
MEGAREKLKRKEYLKVKELATKKQEELQKHVNVCKSEYSTALDKFMIFCKNHFSQYEAGQLLRNDNDQLVHLLDNNPWHILVSQVQQLKRINNTLEKLHIYFEALENSQEEKLVAPVVSIFDKDHILYKGNDDDDNDNTTVTGVVATIEGKGKSHFN